jgi:hypothetical protein
MSEETTMEGELEPSGEATILVIIGAGGLFLVALWCGDVGTISVSRRSLADAGGSGCSDELRPSGSATLRDLRGDVGNGFGERSLGVGELLVRPCVDITLPA